MSNRIEKVVLSSPHPHGDRLPPHAVGQALVLVPELVRQSVDMVFRGQSAPRGRRPHWLKAAADIALVDVSGGETSVLTFEAPTLGEAAPELYWQGEFPWTDQPDAADTGFDLLGDVLTDVARENAESDRFDAPLLERLGETRRIFNGAYSELAIISHRHGVDDPALLNPANLEIARQLHDRTPRPQAAIIVGKLDMMRQSTQTFALIMDDGQEVRCVLLDDDVEMLKPLFNQRVAVSGRVVFRVSGRILRMEAESVRLAVPTDAFFARLPRPNAQRFDLRRMVREQGSKRGLAAIMGKWPGDETDEEIDQWLREIS